jgi:hypothetical protein
MILSIIASIILQATPPNGRGYLNYLLIVLVLAIIVLVIRKVTNNKVSNPTLSSKDDVTNSKKETEKQNIKIGIFIALIGVAGIILSQNADFSSEYIDFKPGLLYAGIAALVLGVAFALFAPTEK